MTPDGISDADWDRVYEASLLVVNASAMEDDILMLHYQEALFETLDDLEKRYGRIPSLLATRADFSDDQAQAIRLHEEALAISDDFVSTALSLHSLVGLLIEDEADPEKIGPMLEQLQELARTAPDLFSAGSVDEMREAFDRLKGRS